MSVHDNTCAAIAQNVKETIQRNSTPAVLETQRRLLLHLAEAQQEKRNVSLKKFFFIAVPSLAVIGLAIVLMLTYGSHTPKALPFSVESDGIAQQEYSKTQWLATHNKDKTIRFDQGSVFRLHPQSGARIVDANEDNVTFELSRGILRAEVNGNHHTVWRINAGPYTTTVLGTRFMVTWSPENEQFQVDVENGLVQVRSDHLHENGVHVKAGEHFLSNGKTHTLTSEDIGPTRTMESGTGEPANKTDGSTKITVPLSNPPAATIAAAEPTHKNKKIRNGKDENHLDSKSWQSLFEQRKFSDAVAAAQRVGIANIYRDATAKELWNLSLAARNTREFKLSTQTLLQLRKRFPASRQAQLAAFVIGRTQMDVASDTMDATRWFNIYLKESGTGSMAEESYGRLMTCYNQLGKRDTAADVAKAYLKYYPHGLYTDKAKKMLTP